MFPAAADPSLCAPDSSIMKVSAVQLAESDTFYRISSQGRTDSVSGPFNTAQTPAERVTGPAVGQSWSERPLLKEHGNILARTCFQTDKQVNISFTFWCSIQSWV